MVKILETWSVMSIMKINVVGTVQISPTLQPQRLANTGHPWLVVVQAALKGPCQVHTRTTRFVFYFRFETWIPPPNMILAGEGPMTGRCGLRFPTLPMPDFAGFGAGDTVSVYVDD